MPTPIATRQRMNRRHKAGVKRRKDAITPAAFTRQLEVAMAKRDRNRFIHKFNPLKVDWQTLGLRPRHMPQGKDDPGESVRSWLADPVNGAVIAKLYGLGVMLQQLCVALQCSSVDLIFATDNWPELWQEARRARGALHAERAEGDIEDMAKGRLLPDQARVLITGRQWMASKFDRAGFGDRSQHELMGEGGGPVKVEPDEAAVNRLVGKLLGPVVATQPAQPAVEEPDGE